MKRFPLFLSTVVLCCLAVAGHAKPDKTVDVIVSLKASQGPAAAALNRATAEAFALQLGVTPRFTYGTVFSGFAARLPEATVEALRRNPNVESVSIDGIAHTTAQSVPWGIDRVDAELNANTGAGVHVYIIDTGIDSNHPDLQSNLGNGYAAISCQRSFIDIILGKPHTCAQSWDDDNGHGTHVAGTVGAIDNDIAVLGVAPDTTLHAVKVLDGLGSGSFSQIIAGVDWVAGQVANRGQAAVANMSLGGAGSKTGTCNNGVFTGSDNLHRAICNAAAAGVVFAVAAGNDGADASGSVPAAFDDAVITVSATQQGDDWASFSNWGDDSAGWTSNPSAPVAIAAPGAAIVSTWFDGATRSLSGTSMAAPHVAGGAALFLAATPQSADFSAFVNVRQGLLEAAESTDTFSNTTGDPHEEDFLDAESL